VSFSRKPIKAGFEFSGFDQMKHLFPVARGNGREK